MKIAIYHNLPQGGARRVLSQINDCLIKQNHTIHFYSIGEKQFFYPPDKSQSFFIKVIPWKGFIKRNIWILLKLRKVHKYLAEKINNSNYDLVIVNHDYLTKSPFILRYLKVKSLYFCHEPQREFYESWDIHTSTVREKIANIFRYPIKFVDEKNVRYANKIIANSQYSQGVIKRAYGLKSDLIYPAVDTAIFKPTVNKKNIILTVGGINKVKDPYFILEAIKPFLRNNIFYIIGNGKQGNVDRLLTIAGRYNKKIKIISDISDKKLVDLYSSAKVVCVGAHDEPFGLSSIEAQACGTPVVAVNEGGVRETVSDLRTGCLVERDILVFRKCVGKYIARKGRCDECTKHASKWDIDRWEKDLSTVIRNI